MLSELDTLQAIYADDLQVIKSEGNPDRVSVNLHPGVGDSAAEQSVFITLEFIIPEKYPEEVPELAIHNPRDFGEDDIKSMLAALRNLTAEKKGQPMLHDILELAKERLIKGNVAHGDCAICLETFRDGQAFRKTRCCHYFHVHCLRDYVQSTTLTAKDSAVAGITALGVEPSKEVLCPVCSAVVDVTCEQLDIAMLTDVIKADVGDGKPEVVAAAMEVVGSPEEQEIEVKMAQVFVHQLEQDDIIDSEAKSVDLAATDTDVTTIQPNPNTEAIAASVSGSVLSEVVATSLSESAVQSEGTVPSTSTVSYELGPSSEGDVAVSSQQISEQVDIDKLLLSPDESPIEDLCSVSNNETLTTDGDKLEDALVQKNSASDTQANSESAKDPKDVERTERNSEASKRGARGRERSHRGRGGGGQRPRGAAHTTAGDSAGKNLACAEDGKRSAESCVDEVSRSADNNGESSTQQRPIGYWKRQRMLWKLAKQQKSAETAAAGVDVAAAADSQTPGENGGKPDHRPSRGRSYGQRRVKRGESKVSESKSTDGELVGSERNKAHAVESEEDGATNNKQQRRRHRRQRLGSAKENREGEVHAVETEGDDQVPANSPNRSPTAQDRRRRNNQRRNRQNSGGVEDASRCEEGNYRNIKRQTSSGQKTRGYAKQGNYADERSTYYRDVRYYGGGCQNGYYGSDTLYHNDRDWYYDDYYNYGSRRQGYGPYRRYDDQPRQGGAGGKRKDGRNGGYASHYDNRKTGREFYERMLKDKERDVAAAGTDLGDATTDNNRDQPVNTHKPRRSRGIYGRKNRGGRHDDGEKLQGGDGAERSHYREVSSGHYTDAVRERAGYGDYRSNDRFSPRNQRLYELKSPGVVAGHGLVNVLHS